MKAFAVHTGVDQQRNGRTPLDGLRLTKAHSRECTLFVAGGVTLSTLPSYITLGADVVIVGSGIRHAAEPAAEARAFQALLRQSSQGVGSAFVLPGVYARSGEDQTGNMAELARQVLQELDRTVLAISTPEADRLVEAIMGARRVFVAGAGRSGLAVKAFAMRLMHIGMQIFVAGEIVTPSISGHDLLFIGSGSGATPSLCVLAERARAAGAKVALATSFPESLLGAIADVIVKIPTPTPNSPIQEQAASVQPMGSLFEQSLLLFLDVIVLRLMQRTSTQVDAMFKRHANLE